MRNQGLTLVALCVASLILRPENLRAEELLPADKSISAAVDHYIDAALGVHGVQPASPADDAVLLRRLTLDLVGRVPTVREVRRFIESKKPNKLDAAIDALLASKGFVRHQVDELDTLLMYGTGASLRSYLETAVQEKRPWNEIFRQLVLPNQTDEKEKASAEFLKRRVSDVDRLTNDVSVVFFGVNVSCSKCHDHPLVEDWKQDHFFGMKSFFNRTFDNGGFLAERDYGLVSFKTTAGESKQARLMFLSGTVLDEPVQKKPSDADKKAEKAKLEEFKKKKEPLPLPAYSRRKRLVEIALSPGDDRFFAKAIVNRLVYRLFGHGLVNPVDQMHTENTPTHPELLDWLARDLVAHKYDLRRTIAGLVRSKAYGRTSRWESPERPSRDLFAVAIPRALTPNQFGASLRVASTDPETFPADMKPEDFENRVESLASSGRGFASMFEMPQDDFQVSVDEALLFSNSDRIRNDLLSDGGDRLVARLKQTEDPAERARVAIWTVLSRPPHDDEVKLLVDYINQRKDRDVEACRQIVWSLLASTGFRFNF